MAENKQLPVITISREYGAGGRSVARRLAEKLGIEFYDKDFVRLTAKVSGYSEEDVWREGENMSSGAHFLNQFLGGTAAYNNSYDEIFQAQRAVIEGLAEKPCIIVGRCANWILREANIPCFSVFLYGTRAYRLQKTIEIGEYGKMDPEKYLDRRDHWRQTYYRAYTGHEMGVCSDYDICLDTGRIGIDTCVDLITQILTK